VVLFPSCSCRMLDNLKQPAALVNKIQLVLARLGYEVIYPEFKNECCGLMYVNEGLPDLAAQKRARLFAALSHASAEGAVPILTENASCALELKTQGFALKIEDALHFLAVALKAYPLKQLDRSVMLHVNCSVTRLQEQNEIIALAKRCAREVIIPPDIYCCGFAGGKGFTHPELNQNALKTLKRQIPATCKEGYTALQTCAIGLSKQADIPYYSLLDLIIAALPMPVAN
jgi:Fe-S oxidoreductase